jgi:hypothetical protein
MQYPSRSEYCSSVRNPQFAFRKKDPRTQVERDLDASLVAGKPVEKRNFDGSTTVWSASGSFGVVFKYETVVPRKIWALKCFCRSNFEVVERYQKILSKLTKTACDPYFVEFSLLEEGIRVLGHCYPLIKMEWAEGDNLKKFLKANLGNKALLTQLAERFLQFSQDFLAAEMAHGDLQHGNILIENTFNHLSIKVIDYDSLYFAGDWAEDNIKGIADYQHPLRGTLKKRCRELDFFSQLVIYLSILGLAENRDLWELYQLDQREGLLFSRLDFQNPHSANIFKSLTQLPAPIPELTQKLKAICQLKDFAKIPSLAQVVNPDEALVLAGHTAPLRELSLNVPALPDPRLLWQKSRDWLSDNISDLASDAIRYAISAPPQALPDGPQTQPAPNPITQINPFAPVTLVPVVAPVVPVAISVPVSTTVEVRVPSSSSKSLRWDPRPHKTHTLPNPLPENPISENHMIETPGSDGFHAEGSNLEMTNLESAQFEQSNLGTQSLGTQAALTLYKPAFNNSADRFFQDLISDVKQGFRQGFKKAEDQFRHAYGQVYQKGVEQLETLQSKLNHSLKDRLAHLRTQLRPKTCTTAEVAIFLGCSVNWCHQQRYRFPEQLREDIHYFKDGDGLIQWTKQGIRYLQHLHVSQQRLTVPTALLPTKEVSQQLQVLPERITKIKAKYTAQFQEGLHYHTDARKRYYWTPEGIILLEQFLVSDATTSPSSGIKAKPSLTKPKR